MKRDGKTYPGPARERSRVIVDGVGALDVADRKHARSHVGRESPISNGVTTVAAEAKVSEIRATTKKCATNVGRILDDELEIFIMGKFDMGCQLDFGGSVRRG